MADAECYVCTGTVPRPWSSACACNDLYIHETCLLELLKSQQQNLEKALCCSVCNQKYGNVEHRYVKRLYCAREALWEPVCLWFFVILNTGMLLSACIVGYHCAHAAPESKSRDSLLITTIIYATSSAAMWLSWFIYVARRGARVLWKPCTRSVSEFRVWSPD